MPPGSRPHCKWVIGADAARGTATPALHTRFSVLARIPSPKLNPAKAVARRRSSG